MIPPKVPEIPALSAQVPVEIRRAVDVVRNFMRDLRGNGGAITLKDLADSGLLNLRPYTPTVVVYPVPGEIENFTAVGGFNSIILSWDTPIGVAYVEIWRNGTEDWRDDEDVIGTAIMVGTTIASIYVDTPPDNSIKKEYYYWVRGVNADGVAGPWNALEGTLASTADDPLYLLEVLQGELRTDQFVDSLANDLDLIVPTEFDAQKEGGYLIDDIVSYGGKTWKCLVDTGEVLPIAAPVAGESWVKVSDFPNLLFRVVGTEDDISVLSGVVASRTGSDFDPQYIGGYVVGELVYFGGKTWKCLVDTGEVLPIADPVAGLVWKKISDHTSLVAMVAEEQGARVDRNGVIESKFTVKVDVDGYVAGIGLIATENEGVPDSEFIVRAEKFLIAPTEADPGSAPFFVLTSERTVSIGGNSVTLPAGTYINTAMIGTATIVNAMIKELSADKITTGYLSAARIEAGSLGADLIDARGLSIKDAAGNIILAAGTALDFSLVGGETKDSLINVANTALADASAAGAAAIAANSEAIAAQTAAYNARLVANSAASTASSALTNASLAQSTANAANTALTNIASDNILSPSEKPSVVQDYAVITTEQSGIDAQATSYGITTEKSTYDTAVSALTTYLGTLSGWNTVPGSDVTIVGTTFRSKFADVYTTRQALLNKIAAAAKILADAAQGTANTAASNASTALSNASLAQTTANAANTALTNIASDNILSPSEKPSVVQDYAVITTEQSGIDAQATSYGITTEKSTYDTAVSALTTYMGTLSGWNTVPGSDVTIVGTTFRSKFADVYTTRQALLNKIAAEAGLRASWANVANKSAWAAATQLTNGNISTLLAVKVIGGAYIDDLAVNTLQIAGNAVTVPVVAVATDLGLGTGARTLVSYAYPIDVYMVGKPLSVHAICKSWATAPYNDANYVKMTISASGAGLAASNVAIKVNSAAYDEYNPGADANYPYNMYVRGWTTFTPTTTGTCTITVTVENPANYNMRFTNGLLSILCAKK